MNTRVQIKYPGFMSSEVFNLECGACKSYLTAKAKRGQGKHSISYGVKVTAKSPALQMIEQDDSAHMLRDLEPA